MNIHTLPWPQALMIGLLLSMIVGLLAGAACDWFSQPKREKRAIARKNTKLRKWRRKLHQRIAAEEFDSAWRNGQYSVGRDIKDRFL